jgi:hypothetical protein
MMKNDPRVIYPGTSFYGGGMTGPFGSGSGMGFNTASEMAQPIPQATGLQHPPMSGGLNTPPLSTLFGQPMPGPQATAPGNGML